MSSTVKSTARQFEHPVSPASSSPSASLTFADAADRYLAFIRVERGLSKETVYGYASWLKHFSKWLDENGYPDATLTAFNTDVLTRFLHTLHARNPRPRSIRGVFYPLRGLGEYLIEKGYAEENPAKKIRMPKKDAAIRQTVKDAEVIQLWEAAGRIRQQKRAALARAVLSVFLYGGLRRTEAIGLHLGDVNTEEGSLLVRAGKGSKSRRVFPHPDCIAAIGEWLAFRPDEAPHDLLFIGTANRRMGEKALLTLLEEIKCISGFRAERRVCLHALRHNCATRLLRNGADLGQIQVFLGHTSLLTTQMYLHTGEENIRELAGMTAFDAPTAAKTKSPIIAPEKQERQSGRSQTTARRFTQRRTLTAR